MVQSEKLRIVGMWDFFFPKTFHFDKHYTYALLGVNLATPQMKAISDSMREPQEDFADRKLPKTRDIHVCGNDGP